MAVLDTLCVMCVLRVVSCRFLFISFFQKSILSHWLGAGWDRGGAPLMIILRQQLQLVILFFFFSFGSGVSNVGGFLYFSLRIKGEKKERKRKREEILVAEQATTVNPSLPTSILHKHMKLPDCFVLLCFVLVRTSQVDVSSWGKERYCSMCMGVCVGRHGPLCLLLKATRSCSYGTHAFRKGLGCPEFGPRYLQLKFFFF